MPRLKKADVENMVDAYEADPTGALCRAIAHVLGTDAGTWEESIRACGFDGPRRSALLAEDTGALDELLRDLIELRDIPPAGSHGRPVAGP